MPLFPIVLVVHVSLAIALILPSVLLPFALRAGGPELGASSRILGGLIAFQGTGTLAVGIGLAATGAILVASLGVRLLEQPWLIVALSIYALNLVLATAIQRPNLRRLIGAGAGAGGETGQAGDAPARSSVDRLWRARARRQRYVSYAMAGLIGAIGWLMSTKPALW